MCGWNRIIPSHNTEAQKMWNGTVIGSVILLSPKNVVLVPNPFSQNHLPKGSSVEVQFYWIPPKST